MRAATRLFLTLPVLLLALSGCSNLGGDAPEVQKPENTNQPTPTSTATVTPSTAPAVAPTCEQLAEPALLDWLHDGGYTPTASTFVIGDLSLEPGVRCLWAIPDVGTDSIVLHAWGEISDQDAPTAIASLADKGWVTERGDIGTYVTDPGGGPQQDAEGYVTTYLFGDGWVTLADVKAGLAEIVRPNAG